MRALTIISGPSCAGKTPLFKTLKRYYPSLFRGSRKLVLYTSRMPRPGEKEGVDYYFRSRKEVLGMKSRPGFIVMDVRGDIQALDTKDLLRRLRRASVIFEGNPFIGGALLSLKALEKIKKTGIFISPLSKEELAALKRGKTRRASDLAITRIMERKLLRRAGKYKVNLNKAVLADIKRRAKSAARELKEAFLYEFVIPNHDGEDSPNWKERGKPAGEAARTVRAAAAILKGRRPALAERWGKRSL